MKTKLAIVALSIGIALAGSATAAPSYLVPSKIPELSKSAKGIGKLISALALDMDDRYKATLSFSRIIRSEAHSGRKALFDNVVRLDDKQMKIAEQVNLLQLAVQNLNARLMKLEAKK